VTPFDALFNQAAEVYQVPAWLLEALARRESSLNANTQVWEPRAGQFSWGLGGILESTARGLGFTGPATALKDPAVNVDLMGRLAREIIARQGGLFLGPFYSEWNSGRPELWETSTEVAGNVRKFLANVGQALNRPVTAAAAIGDTLGELPAPAPAVAWPMIALAGVVAYRFLRR
jgi:hypothetical protein